MEPAKMAPLLDMGNPTWRIIKGFHSWILQGVWVMRNGKENGSNYLGFRV